jgi:hypothetical protein
MMCHGVVVAVASCWRDPVQTFDLPMIWKCKGGSPGYLPMLLNLLLVFFLPLFIGINAQLHPSQPAQYKTLSSLREQAKIINRWQAERRRRIHSLLKKYNVDAWLVSPVHCSLTILPSIRLFRLSCARASY